VENDGHFINVTESGDSCGKSEERETTQACESTDKEAIYRKYLLFSFGIEFFQYFSGRWSHVSGRWSHVSGRWSHVSGRWSHASGRWSHFSSRWSHFLAFEVNFPTLHGTFSVLSRGSLSPAESVHSECSAYGPVII
jgi:hypothetical protein